MQTEGSLSRSSEVYCADVCEHSEFLGKKSKNRLASQTLFGSSLVLRGYVILVQRTSSVTRQLEEDNAASAASDLYSAANDVAVRLKPDKSFFFGFSKESRVPRLPCAEHKLFLRTQFGPRGFFLNKGNEKRCLLSRQSEHCSNRLSTCICRGLSFGLDLSNIVT